MTKEQSLAKPNCQTLIKNDVYNGKNGQDPDVRYSGRFR